MKFSIITPVFNGMPQLKCCIGSVRGQKAVEHEHIIQDGVSNDGTVDWLKTQTDLNFRSEPDKGMYDAINRGWSRAKGDILSWLNSDEQYLPGTLNLVREVFEEHHEVDAIYGNMVIVDEKGRPIAARREIPLRAVYVKNRFLYASSCTLFFRKTLLMRGLLKLNTAYRYSADADMILNLLQRGIRFFHIPKYLSLFGVNGNNLTLSPEMKAEGDIIRRKHGRLASPALRRAVIMMRYLEKLFSGCYRKDSFQYQYAVSETPEYRHFECVNLNFRFTWDRFFSCNQPSIP